jgi:hypothetical protein
MKLNLRAFLLIQAMLLISLTTARAAAEVKTTFSKWVDEVEIKGDLRLRHESFWKNPDADRHCQRFRLRVESKAEVKDFTVGVRVATGTGEQTSTNQSFDDLFSQKEFWIDRAYLIWQGSKSKWLTLKGGRMSNPFFRVYSTDAVWDTDVNPEGFAERLKTKFGENSVTLFLNAGQFVLHEDSGDNNDQWLLGQQVGATITPIEDTEATMTVSYYDFVNTSEGPLGGSALDGNSRTGGVLINDYNVLNLTAILELKLGGLPASIMGDYVKNLADPKTAAGLESGDTGYQAGVILGKARNPHTWEVAYFYKVLETDATVADLADADFGDGGTNRRGHIVWGAYNLTEYLQIKTKFLATKVESGAKDDIDRLQADLVMKF